MTADRHTLHIPWGACSAASCHDNIITAAGQSCTTKQSLQSASGRPGFGCQHDITHGLRTVPSVLMSLVINTPCPSAHQPLRRQTACCDANSGWSSS